MLTNFTLVQEAEVEDDEDDDDSMDNETTEADEQVIAKPCLFCESGIILITILITVLITIRLKVIQKTALLGTASIISKVLSL